MLAELARGPASVFQPYLALLPALERSPPREAAAERGAGGCGGGAAQPGGPAWMWREVASPRRHPARLGAGWQRSWGRAVLFAATETEG